MLNLQKVTEQRCSEGSSKAEESNVFKLRFRFVKQAVSLGQKRCAASPTSVSDPTGHEFPGWKHVSLHVLRVHMDAMYREIVDWTVRWIAFVVCYSSLDWHFPHPQLCTDRLRGYPYRYSVGSFGSPRKSAIQARTVHR